MSLQLSCSTKCNIKMLQCKCTIIGLCIDIHSQCFLWSPHSSYIILQEVYLLPFLSLLKNCTRKFYPWQMFVVMIFFLSFHKKSWCNIEIEIPYREIEKTLQNGKKKRVIFYVLYNLSFLQGCINFLQIGIRTPQLECDTTWIMNEKRLI